MATLNLKNTGIRWFTGLIAFLFVIVVLCSYTVYSIITISQYNDLNNQVDKILLESNKCTIAAKEFLLNAYTDEEFVKTGTSVSHKHFKTCMDSILVLMHSFQNSWYLDNNDKKNAFAKLNNAFLYYNNSFDKIAVLYKEKGFKDLGLEGKMRNAIHFIEKHEAPIDLEYLLMLRRHEKDFLLRKDVSYVKKFDDDFIKFETHIQTHNKIYPEHERSKLLAELSVYDATFKQIVEIEKQIGLKPDEGLRYELVLSLSETEGILNKLNNDIKSAKKRATTQINFIICLLVILFAFIIVAAIYGVFYFMESVSRPIHKLNLVADQIAKGNLSVNLDGLKNNKLLLDLVESFDKLMEKLRLTMMQIEHISSRKITTIFELNNERDEIGKSLNKIIAELQTIDDDEQKRTWITEGIAKFGEIIRTYDDLKSLCEAVTSHMVKYLKANQAGFFMVNTNDNETNLELIATYAYNRKKYIHKTILQGEGLVGQCYSEKDTIYITDIPDEYMQITSGLGFANPTSLVIVPVKLNDKVEGVIEIASFQNFEPYQISFIEKTGEMLASAIASAKNNEKTISLLHESQLQAEQLKSQEEEMRQNMEELMSTQEEIQRKEQTYKERIIQLEGEISELKRQSQQIEKELPSIEAGLKSKDRELKRNLEEQSHIREEIHRKSKYPRRIEHFLDS